MIRNIFHHLELENALVIPASNEWNIVADIKNFLCIILVIIFYFDLI